MNRALTIEEKIRARMRRRRWWIRKLLKPLPRRARLDHFPVLRRFARWARSCPHLWLYRRPHLTAALYAGSLLAVLPLLGIHILVALPVAWLLRANLAVMVGLQLLNNVFTAGPLIFVTYKMGAWPLRALSVWMHTPAPGPVLSTAVGALISGLLLGALLDAIVRLCAWSHRRDLASLQRIATHEEFA